ncbi:hypothetical protein D3C81_1379710 [compost metagenome]
MIGTVADFAHDGGWHGYEHYRQGSGQVTDCRLTEPGRLQCGVQLTVLDQLYGFGIRQVFDLAHVLVAEPCCLEDGAGVELGAGLRRTDRDTFAFEVFQRGDA